ncbi:MAG: hypothetical protein JXR78_13825, partial [Victivallales bacterium]|nr:hypothetical protein [Victivallales bacterium]
GKMTERLKETFANNPKAVLAVGAIVLLTLVALYLNMDILPELWPGERRIEQQLEELRKTQELLRNEIERERRFADVIAGFVSGGNYYWLPPRDGEPGHALRKLIETAAADTGLKLTSLGALRESKLENELKIYELNLSASANLEQIMRFIMELEASTPKLYWSQLNFRPDNSRNPENVHFNGTVKAVVIHSDRLIAMLREEPR